MNGETEFDTLNTKAHVTERPDSLAAFFDLDGTLLPSPSLERRFFRTLRYRAVIGLANYLLWVAEAVRLLPGGIKQILYGNKMYLHGVHALEGDTSQRQEAKVRFYPQALERLAWHARRGQAILIVSGTLQPLAINAADALEKFLAMSDIQTYIGVYATRLEVRDGKWTGRIAGEAMFGEAKARAIKQIAESRRLDLERCFAYGNSASDRWMLESVGRPVAVNPSNDLTRIATRNGWPILHWNRPLGVPTNSRCSSVTEGRRAEPLETHSHSLQSKPGNCS